MAISLSGLKQGIAKKSSAKRLAKEYKKQQKRESKRSRWSKFLGGVGGKLLGAGLVGLTGVTGGLAAPLLMAAGSFGAKKLAHDATKGLGAKTGKLKADKYGFGGEEAKTLREGLEQQLRESDPMKQRGAFGGELLGAYASAGLSGQLGGAKTILKGGKGSLMEGMTGQKDWAGGMKILGGTGEIGGVKGALGGISDLLDTSFKNEWGENVSQKDIGEIGEDISGIGEDIGGIGFDDVSVEGGIGFDDVSVEVEQGGLIPSKAPSIVDYFSMKGKTLGGSNTQSLSEMLGRK